MACLPPETTMKHLLANVSNGVNICTYAHKIENHVRKTMQLQYTMKFRQKKENNQSLWYVTVNQIKLDWFFNFE